VDGGIDYGLQPARVGASPVDVPALPTTAEGRVLPAGAIPELRAYLALGRVGKRPVTGRAPGPRLQRRREPVQYLAKLLVGDLGVDVCIRAQGAAVKQTSVSCEQDPLLRQ
jgi:hypothetical protein